MFAQGIAVILTLLLMAVTIVKLRGFQFTTNRVARIGIVTGLTLVLYMIKLVPFPQGGGCSLLSILPMMILAVTFGMEEALVCGIVVGLSKIVIAPPMFPMQIPLDYLGGMMAISLTGLFGAQTKGRIFSGALLAIVLSTFFSILSGKIFFGQFAPEGMNQWLYSTIYNVTGYGVEATLSLIILMVLPLKHFQAKEGGQWASLKNS